MDQNTISFENFTQKFENKIELAFTICSLKYETNFCAA